MQLKFIQICNCRWPRDVLLRVLRLDPKMCRRKGQQLWPPFHRSWHLKECCLRLLKVYFNVKTPRQLQLVPDFSVLMRQTQLRVLKELQPWLPFPLFSPGQNQGPLFQILVSLINWDFLVVHVFGFSPSYALHKAFVGRHRIFCKVQVIVVVLRAWRTLPS